MPKASLHYPKGWWVIGKAHFGNLQPPGEKKKVLSSNPLEYKWNSCQHYTNDFELAITMACQVGFVVVLQKEIIIINNSLP
jgi:hypothetical protein